MNKPANLKFYSAVALCFILLSVVSYLAIEPAVDDAFIVYRYVDRFSEGKGLTFNDGEYVEGYTSLVWTLLLSGVSKAGYEPEHVALWLNYISIILTALVLLWLLTILNISRVIKLTILALYSISVLYFKVVFLGLEFGLYVFLLLLFLCIFLLSFGTTSIPAKHGKQGAIVSGLVGATLFAVRPESITILPTSLLIAYLFRRDARPVKSHLVTAFLVFVLCILVILIWRFLYYGELVPNSVIAKSAPIFHLLTKQSASSQSTWLKGSIRYFWNAYFSSPALLLVMGLLLIAFWKRWRIYEMSLLAAPILWQHIVIVENGGDWMPHYRFIIMYVPLFLAILGLVAEEIRSESSSKLAILLLLFFSLYALPNIRDLNLDNLQAGLQEINDPDYMYQVVGQALREVWQEGDILIPEAGGRISYIMPETYIHEPNGLVDKVLANDKTAKRSVFGRTSWRYSLSLNPAVIILHYWPHQYAWNELVENYPEDFAFYCMPPLPTLSVRRMLYIIVRADRIAQYGPALRQIGAERVPYFTDPEIAQPLNCSKS